MAKSKKKTSKTRKSNKSQKINKSTKANNTAVKNKVERSAPASPKNANLEAVVVKQVSNGGTPLVVAVIVSFAVAILLGLLLIGTAEDKTIQSSAKPTTNPNSQQTIEVSEPNSSTPEPTGYQIQGSMQTGQTAQGGLQQPQTADQLQPNAKIKDYENAELN